MPQRTEVLSDSAERPHSPSSDKGSVTSLSFLFVILDGYSCMESCGLTTFPSLSSTFSSSFSQSSLLYTFFFPELRILLVACGLTKGEKQKKKKTKSQRGSMNLRIIFWCILASFCKMGPIVTTHLQCLYCCLWVSLSFFFKTT